MCVCLDAGWCMISTFKRLEIVYTFLWILVLGQAIKSGSIKLVNEIWIKYIPLFDI